MDAERLSAAHGDVGTPADRHETPNQFGLGAKMQATVSVVAWVGDVQPGLFSGLGLVLAMGPSGVSAGHHPSRFCIAASY